MKWREYHGEKLETEKRGCDLRHRHFVDGVFQFRRKFDERYGSLKHERNGSFKHEYGAKARSRAK